jgi:hypothetical protein
LCEAVWVEGLDVEIKPPGIRPQQATWGQPETGVRDQEARMREEQGGMGETVCRRRLVGFRAGIWGRKQEQEEVSGACCSG